MPKIFTTLDKIKPAYDITYKVVLFICKILLILDILITTMSVIGRYVPFIPDPAWSEEVVLTCMSYMAVLSAALAIRRGAHIRMTAFDVYLPKTVVKVLDILADEKENGPEDTTQDDDMKQSIVKWLFELNAKQREVRARRFGLLGYEAATLEDVGREIGLTRERVRQIQVEGLRRLREILQTQGLNIEALFRE